MPPEVFVMEVESLPTASGSVCWDEAPDLAEARILGVMATSANTTSNIAATARTQSVMTRDLLRRGRGRPEADSGTIQVQQCSP